MDTAVADVDLEPPKLSSKPPDPDTVEMVKVFEVDDVPYFIAKHPPASAVLKFMRSAREQGQAFAMQEMVESLLGTDNYIALENCPTLGMEEWGTITAIVSKHTVGLFKRFTEASGNSSGGSQG